MSGKVDYVNSIHGGTGFRVTIEDPGERRDLSFQATVDLVTGWTEIDGPPCEFEPYLSCMIKSDGCSHFWMGDLEGETGRRDGYFHFCGVDDFKNHALLLEALHRMAFREMGREDRPEAQW